VMIPTGITVAVRRSRQDNRLRQGLRIFNSSISNNLTKQ
jgi:hypothetical protein